VEQQVSLQRLRRLLRRVVQSLPDDARMGSFPADALARGYAIAARGDGHASDPVGMAFDGSWARASLGVPNEEALTGYYYRAVYVVTLAEGIRAAGIRAPLPARTSSVARAAAAKSWSRRRAIWPTTTVTSPAIRSSTCRTRFLPDAPPALLEAPDSHTPAPAHARRLGGVRQLRCSRRPKGQPDPEPGECAFDPQSLRCTAGNTANCLTDNQVSTLNAWFSAARDEQGRVASFGFPVSNLYNNGAAGNSLFM
jgi:feruloyl esterase